MSYGTMRLVWPRISGNSDKLGFPIRTRTATPFWKTLLRFSSFSKHAIFFQYAPHPGSSVLPWSIVWPSFSLKSLTMKYSHENLTLSYIFRCWWVRDGPAFKSPAKVFTERSSPFVNGSFRQFRFVSRFSAKTYYWNTNLDFLYSRHIWRDNDIFLLSYIFCTFRVWAVIA